MSQGPASSQLSFFSAAEEFDKGLPEDLNFEDAPFNLDNLPKDDQGPLAFENPAEDSEWTTTVDPRYTGSYRDVTDQINAFTGPRGYAVLARHPKGRANNAAIINPCGRSS